jgi:hypothetical protein
MLNYNTSIALKYFFTIIILRLPKKYMDNIDKNTVIQKIQSHPDPEFFIVFDDIWKDDELVAKEAIKRDPHNYKYISERLKLDRDMALFAVKTHVEAIRIIPKRFSREKGFLIDAVKDNGKLFRKIHKSFKGVKEIAYFALKDDPTIVSSFSDYLMNQIGKSDPLKYLEASLLLKELEAEIVKPTVEPKKLKI